MKPAVLWDRIRPLIDGGMTIEEAAKKIYDEIDPAPSYGVEALVKKYAAHVVVHEWRCCATHRGCGARQRRYRCAVRRGGVCGQFQKLSRTVSAFLRYSIFR